MTAPDLPPPQVCALLRFAWQELQVEMFNGMRAAGFDDLRPVHQPVFRYPGMDGRRPTELAASLGRSKQHVNDIVRDLERLGYLYLEPDPDDKRARVIRLTERGWAMYNTGSALSRAVGRRWAQQIGEEKYAAFEDALREIAALTASAHLLPSARASP
jgi:DNA-binding MarR family transcriptional regulator